MMIGIDFGTTNSSVAVYRAVGAEMIETVDNLDLMPSAVAQLEGGQYLTGQPALLQMRRNPEFTFRNIKRYIGREFDEQEHGHFQLAEGEDGKVWFRGRTGLISGPTLVAEVFKSILLAAEYRLGRKPMGAVVAVPVDFREPQRAAIIEAARLAGISKVVLEEEPQCAALAFGLDRQQFTRVAVYDFGGGTFDITILRMKGGNIKPLGMSGTAQVGGADFDQRLADHAMDKFLEAEGEDLRANPLQMVGILRAAEDAKKTLSRLETATVADENVAFPKSGLASLDVPVTRSEFEDMTMDLVTRTIASVQDALARADTKASEIDKVLLVGGQSRMPLIRGVLEDMFGAKKIEKNGPKPELAVALGAAIRAAELEGRIKPALMQRLIPASIGIRVAGGAYYAFIKKGETSPIRRERVLRAAHEGQVELEMIVLEGEEPVAADNTEVCRIIIPVNPNDRPPVMLDIDRSGRLQVWAAGQIVYGESEEAA